MRRRPLAEPAAEAVPRWIFEYDQSAWTSQIDPGDEAFIDLAHLFGTQRARQVIAHGNWSRARRTWLDQNRIKQARSRQRKQPANN